MDMYERVCMLARTARHLLLATADAQGIPHLATVQRVLPLDNHRLQVISWLCPGSLRAVAENRKVALIILDDNVQGYQVTGDVEETDSYAMVDGYSPREEQRREPGPQTEWRLVLRIQHVMYFKDAPHADTELFVKENGRTVQR